MNTIKEYIMISIMAMAIMIMTGVAKAEETTTFGDFVSALASVPGKIINHVKSEAEDIKEYQQDSWADAKSKWPFKQNSAE
jgi:hypothetical protein